MTAAGWIVGYQLLSAALVLGGLVYLLRRRDPLYLGLYLGSAVGGGVFEWIFDTRWYFNLTTDERLVPLWRIDGVPAPLAMIFFYTFFFGIPLVVLMEHADALFARFGRRGCYLGLTLVAAVGVLAFESFNTSVIGVYAYHQRPEFLLLGMPWSNLWFSPLIFCFAFWGALRARDLVRAAPVVSPSGAELGARPSAPRSTALALGFAVLVTAYFAAATLNGIWYALATPWTESGRPF